MGKYYENEPGETIEFDNPLEVIENFHKEHRQQMTSEQRMMFSRAEALLQLRKGEAW